MFGYNINNLISQGLIRIMVYRDISTLIVITIQVVKYKCPRFVVAPKYRETANQGHFFC